MQTLKMDFQSQSSPPVVPVMQFDAQSRFIGITLYNGGIPYEAPEGASYTVEYRGPGANNTGWYDTIQLSSGTRKAVIVDSASKNVVTLELAEQALRVNGNVFVNLCVVTNTGYMLKTFPILCRVTGAAFPDTVAVQSFFYVTGLTSAQWLAYVTACQDAQKRAEDAAAKLVIDPTLSLSGKAADAAKVGEAVGQLKENISKNVFTKLGTKYVVTQSKISNHDIVLHKGNYVFSQSELGVETTVILYNTDTYQSGNPDNFKVWDDLTPTATVPLVVNISLPKDYKHIYIWQSPTNTNVVLNIEQIGSVTDSITKIDNVFGKEILQLNAGTKITSFNNINGLTKDKAFVFVMNARPNNLVIKLDTNEVYDTNSQNLLTVANIAHADEDVYISDVVILDKDYKSARTYNNSTYIGDKVFVYEINYVEKETINAGG